MKKKLLWITFLLLCSISYAQNLVPNGDFETYTGCPDDISEIDSAMFWMNPTTGDNGNGSTPDYFNQCASSPSAGVPINGFGYQQAHSGVGYSGVYLGIYPTNYREYIEVPLTSPLIASSTYYFEMYVSLGDNGQFTTDAIGIYFSTTAITGVNNFAPLPYTPQINNAAGTFDTLSWTLVTGSYTATGGESFLIIGNFKDDLNTTYTLVNSPAPLPGAYVYMDDVALTITTGIKELNNPVTASVYPNPATDKITISVSNNELSEFILSDIASREVLFAKFTTAVSLNAEQLKSGVYFYEVRNKDGVIRTGKVIKE